MLPSRCELAPDPATKPEPGDGAGWLRRDTRSKLALLCIAVATLCVQRGATLSWGSAEDPGDGRYKLSPIGLTFTATSDSGAVNVVACRWWPRLGDADLCAVAPEGADAFASVRMAYPLLSLSLWVAVAALLMQVLRVPRRTGVRTGVTWLSGAFVAMAVVLLTAYARPALASLVDRDVRFGALGFGLAIVAMVAAFLSGWLHLTGRSDRATPA